MTTHNTGLKKRRRASISFLFTLTETLKTKSCARWLADGAGALIAVALGAALLYAPFGNGITHLSYDLLFALPRSVAPPDEVVMVYLDENAYKDLKQPFNQPWDRALHARLLERLAIDQAKAVVFDIVFSDPGPDEKRRADDYMAAAMKTNGRVVLGADYKKIGAMDSLVKPWDRFREAAAAWGVVQIPHAAGFVIREHADFAIHQQSLGAENLQSLAWAAAQLVGAEGTRMGSPGAAQRWLNYYGPPGTFEGRSYHQALYEDGVPPGFFRDKVVFIGQRLLTGFPGEGKDEFGTVYTRWSNEVSPGVEIHATAFVNLLRQDWLTRLPKAAEFALIMLTAFAFGIGLILARPWWATAWACAGALLTLAIAWILFRFYLLWFAWLIVVLQIGVALFWSILSNSMRLYVDKRLLEQSLQYHLSPSRIEQLLENPDLLKRGGKQQQVSILFSDIADFSKLAQTLDPDDLFNLLNQYFDAALKGIHERDGTVVQLIGDAILAVWNAPVEQADHAARACHAAVELNEQLFRFDAKQDRLPMRTRVGIHTGMATVGNLGSTKRFDFATIGESVNLASRLEGLNKHLRTEILATRAAQKSVDGELLCRPVGYFQFKGFGQPIEVHELLGPLDPEHVAKTQTWREAFGEGLKQFHRKQFATAEQKFRLAIKLRQETERSSLAGGAIPSEDGPSSFYLARIEEFKSDPPSDHWRGEIEMKEK